MSLIPEILLQRVIINGFRQIRKDSRLLDAVFRNLHQEQLSAVKEFILNNSIDFSINYPRKDLRLPSIVLLLKNENEGQTYLGDVLGDSTHPGVPDPELSIDTLGGHSASVSDSKGLTRKVLGPLTVESGTDSSITFTDDVTEFIEELRENPVESLKVHVVQGTGAGQVRDVQRIKSNGLDIVGTFALNLDNTSIIDLRVADDSELMAGEPSRVYSADSSSVTRKGAHYDVNYQVHILAGQQDQVIYLYAVVKALLLSQRQFLESQGLQALKIGGSDFAPRTEFLPTEAFQRMMTMQFTYLFNFLEDQETFDKIAVDLVPEPTDDIEGSTLVGATITLD